MAEFKTRRSDASVTDFLRAVGNEERRADAFRLLELMKTVTGEPPAMWGPSIVGFGSYHYRYASGREGDWMITGFSPRKDAMTVYIMPGFADYAALLARLGPHKTSVSCLYIKRLKDVDETVLAELVRRSVVAMRQAYPAN